METTSDARHSEAAEETMSLKLHALLLVGRQCRGLVAEPLNIRASDEETSGIGPISELVSNHGNVVAIQVVGVHDSCSRIPADARRIFPHIHHDPGNIVGSSADEN